MKLTIFHLFGLLNKNTAKEDDDSDKQNASETLSKHNNNNNNDGDSDDNSRSNNSRSNCNNNDETKKSMNNDDDTDRCNGSTTKTTSTIAWRELISFWIFGLCTEFGYVVMICAAYDILSRFDNVRTCLWSLLSFNEEPSVLSAQLTQWQLRQLDDFRVIHVSLYFSFSVRCMRRNGFRQLMVLMRQRRFVPNNRRAYCCWPISCHR